MSEVLDCCFGYFLFHIVIYLSVCCCQLYFILPTIYPQSHIFILSFYLSSLVSLFCLNGLRKKIKVWMKMDLFSTLATCYKSNAHQVPVRVIRPGKHICIHCNQVLCTLCLSNPFFFNRVMLTAWLNPSNFVFVINLVIIWLLVTRAHTLTHTLHLWQLGGSCDFEMVSEMNWWISYYIQLGKKRQILQHHRYFR